MGTSISRIEEPEIDLPENAISSCRNVTNIVETTNNFMETLETCTKDEQIGTYIAYRGGIRVEDLINKFKSETKFNTMNKG